MAQKSNPRSLRNVHNFNGINNTYADVLYGNLLQQDWNSQSKSLEFFSKCKRFKVIKAPSRRRRKKPAVLAASLFINHLPYKSVYAGIWCSFLPKTNMRSNFPLRKMRKKAKYANSTATLLREIPEIPEIFPATPATQVPLRVSAEPLKSRINFKKWHNT